MLLKALILCAAYDYLFLQMIWYVLCNLYLIRIPSYIESVWNLHQFSSFYFGLTLIVVYVLSMLKIKNTPRKKALYIMTIQMINNVVDYVIDMYDSRHMCLYSYLRMGCNFKKPLRCCFFWVYIIHFANYVFMSQFFVVNDSTYENNK